MLLTTKKTAATFALGVCGGTDYAITGVDLTSNFFTVSGDQSVEFATGDLGVLGSTSNDGVYTITSATYNSTPGTTDIVVVQTIPSATVDGNLYYTQVPTSSDYVLVTWDITAEGDLTFDNLCIYSGATLTCGDVVIVNGGAWANNLVSYGTLYCTSLTFTNGWLNTVAYTSGIINCSGDIITGAISGSLALNTGGISAVNITTTTIGSSFADSLANVSCSGDIVTGDITNHFATYSLITATNITTGSIGSDFANGSSTTITAYGAVTTGGVSYFSNYATVTVTGNIYIGGSYQNGFSYGNTANVSANNITVTGTSGNFADNGRVTAAGNIDVKDVYNFATNYASVYSVNITTGATSLDFAYLSYVNATGYIVTGIMGQNFSNASQIYATNITIDLNGTGFGTGYFAENNSTISVSGNIIVSKIGAYFAYGTSTITVGGYVQTNDISYDFTNTSTVNITGNLTITGNIGANFATESDVDIGGNILVDGTIAQNFAKVSGGACTVNAVNITVTGLISQDFASSGTNVIASGDITTSGDINGSFNYISAVQAVNITISFVGDFVKGGNITTSGLIRIGGIQNCFAVYDNYAANVSAVDILTGYIGVGISVDSVITARDFTCIVYAASYLVATVNTAFSSMLLTGNLLIYGGTPLLASGTGNNILSVSGYTVVNRNAIPNLAAGNIKDTINILDIIGTLASGGGEVSSTFIG